MSLACPVRSGKRLALRRGLRIEALERRLLLANGGTLPELLALGERSFERTYRDLSLSPWDEPVDQLQISVEHTGRLTVRTQVAQASDLDLALAVYDSRSGDPLMGSDDSVRAAAEGGSDRDAWIEVHLAQAEYAITISASPFANSEHSEDHYTLVVNWEPTGPLLRNCETTTPGTCPYRVEGQPWGITSADFNGDGYLDLATANSLSNDVSIALGQGDGSFRVQQQLGETGDTEKPLTFGVGQSPISIVAADFNQDGQIDLAVANSASHDISVLFGRGDGTFEPELRMAVGEEPRFINAADLNRDTYPDLLVVHQASEDLWVLMGAADGAFHEARRYVIGGSPRHVATADIDGDGFLDVVVPRRSYDDVMVLLSQRDGAFLVPQEGDNDKQEYVPVTFGVGDGPYVVTIADFNDDNRLDLATTNDRSGTVSVLIADHDQQEFNSQWFNTSENYETGPDAEYMLTGDFNGDGWIDLVAGNEDSRDLSILLNRGEGDGRFEAERRVQIYCLPDELAAGDFNGDGRSDLAIVSREEELVILLGLGDGQFVRGPLPRVGNLPEAMVWDDFNRDGLPDLATANGQSDDVSVLLGRGDGSFQPETRYAVGDAPLAIISLDLNLDGRSDLVTTNTGSNSVSILLGNGDGTFSPAASGLPETAAWGDFNGDGIWDVASVGPLFEGVTVELGNADGGFDEPTGFSLSGAKPYAITIVDADDDGRVDLAMLNEDSDDASILFGDGAGEFHTRALTKELQEALRPIIARGFEPVGLSPASIVAGNFDNDIQGFPDLAIANRISNNVTVLYATGEGRFRPEYFPVGGFPEWIAAGDFNEDGLLDLATVDRLPDDVNEDGLLDLATVNRLPDVVSVLYGRGPDGFDVEKRSDRLPESLRLDMKDGVPSWVFGQRADAAKQSVYFYPRRFATDDFNEDGILDVVVTNDVANQFSVFLGYGDGTFQPEIRFPTLDDPEFVTTADFNGDGHRDLLLCHDHEDSMSIWLGSGTGSFRLLLIEEVGKGPEFAVVEDLNADGISDVAIHVDKKHASLVAGSDVLFYFGKGDGTFQQQKEMTQSVPLQAQGMVSRDFDGDGLFDLAIVNDKAGCVTVLLRNHAGVEPKGGDGRFQPAMTYQLPPDLRQVGMPRSIDAHDLDGDGYLDLVFTELYQDGIWVLWGEADGKFADPVAIRQPGPDDANIATLGDHADTPLVIADFDGNGHPDIAKSNELLDNISILWGEGNRQFRDGDSISVGDGPEAIAVADFNLDHKPDLIVGHRNSYDVWVLLGNGDESFRTPNESGELRFAGGQQPPPVVTEDDRVDLNLDGHPERITVDTDRGEIQVQLSLADGSFVDSEQVAAEIQGSPQKVDLNGDGHLDLVQISLQGEMLFRLWQSNESPYYGSKQRVVPDNRDLQNFRDLAVLTGHDSALLAALRQDPDGGSIQLYQWSAADQQLEPFGEPIAAGRLSTRIALWTRIAAGRLNEDEFDDLVVIDAAGPIDGRTEPGSVFLRPGYGPIFRSRFALAPGQCAGGSHLA